MKHVEFVHVELLCVNLTDRNLVATQGASLGVFPYFDRKREVKSEDFRPNKIDRAQ